MPSPTASSWHPCSKTRWWVVFGGDGHFLGSVFFRMRGGYGQLELKGRPQTNVFWLFVGICWCSDKGYLVALSFLICSASLPSWKCLQELASVVEKLLGLHWTASGWCWVGGLCLTIEPLPRLSEVYCRNACAQRPRWECLPRSQAKGREGGGQAWDESEESHGAGGSC